MNKTDKPTDDDLLALMGDDHPFEIYREGVQLPVGCELGHLQDHMHMYANSLSAFGVGRDRIARNGDNLLPCNVGLRSSCAGYTKADFGVNSSDMRQGVVTGRCGCYCLRMIPDGGRHPFHWIMAKKYESPYLVACGVVRFLLSTLCILPTRITLSHEEEIEDTTRAFYHLQYDADGFTNVVEVQSASSEDGGYYMECTMTRDNAQAGKKCLQCNYETTNVPAGQRPDEKFLFVFTIGCGLHVVCEKCALEFFLKKPEEDDIPEDLTFTLNRCAEVHCTGCKEDVPALATTPLGENAVDIRAPVPVLFLGQKAVISKPVIKCLFSFYKRHISWFIACYKTVPEQNAIVHTKLRQKQAARDNIQRQPNMIGPMLDHLKALISEVEVLRRDYNTLGSMSTFLDQKRHHIIFALNGQMPFPQQLLNLNSCFFETSLERSRFRQLSLRLRTCTVADPKHPI